MTFHDCTIIVAMVFSILVYGQEDESTKGLPFCHELTPAPPGPCMSSPCVTGVCTDLENGQFECSCTAGWHGRLCNTGFLCGDGGNTCLPFSAVCNRTQECANFFDQRGCCDDCFDYGQSDKKAHSSFKCGGSPYCVLSDKVCNGQEDCVGATLDETYFCGDTCTVTASPLLSTETPAILLPSTVQCITTQVSSTGISESSAETTNTAYGMMSISSAEHAEHEGKGFFDDTKNVAGVAAGVGGAVAGGVAFGLTAKFCKANQGSGLT